MKLFLFILLVIFVLYVLFYGAYYIFNPSLQGKEIMGKFNIPYPGVIAQRGASVAAPESTLPAYEHARELGANYLEADLQRTKDGEIVVFHDKTLKRTSNIEEVFPERVNDYIGEFTLEELKQLDFGSWFNEAYPHVERNYENLKILTLEELISIAEEGDNNPGLCLELKYPELYSGIEEDIINVLVENNWLKDEDMENNRDSDIQVGKSESRIIFFSFNIQTLERLKRLAPQFPRLLLLSNNMISRRGWSRWVNIAEDTVHGLGPKGFISWPWHIAAAHNKGLFVFPYVVNQAWQVKLLSQFSADGYITDRPELILDFLGRLENIGLEIE